jgi:hypothetical protein
VPLAAIKTEREKKIQDIVVWFCKPLYARSKLSGVVGDFVALTQPLRHGIVGRSGQHRPPVPTPHVSQR